jgi:hypothetical protein
METEHIQEIHLLLRTAARAAILTSILSHTCVRVRRERERVIERVRKIESSYHWGRFCEVEIP